MNVPSTILIVDDVAANRETLSALLEPAGYRLIESADGPSALRLAAETEPDLILLDVMMPGMDGFEVCRRIRSDKRISDVPVVMVTALDDENSRISGLRAGADDFVTKPFNRAELRARVRTITRLNRYRRLMDAQVQLRESEARFHQLAELSSEVFWFVGLDPERLLYVSPAAESIWGLPAAELLRDYSLWMGCIHSSDAQRVETAWKHCLSGQIPSFDEEYRIIRSDGSVRWVLNQGTFIRGETGFITSIGGVVRNVTERKEGQQQMLRAQRMESIGNLAGGIAHDLNNALAPIMMSVEMLRPQLPSGSGTKFLDVIFSSAKRGAEMVRQLLNFARGAEGERKSVESEQVFSEIEKLVRNTFPKNIAVSCLCDVESELVIGDHTQLHQVLLNLCVNARDAMPDGGKLTLRATVVEIDTVYASGVPDAKPGRYVVWRVEDTGTGIPSDVLERIFEPFFTTKGPEKGTGLGLSTVLGIVKGHGGFMRVYSHKNQGSTFAVYLPVSREGISGIAKMNEPAYLQGNGEEILVVEDEQEVREVVRSVLTFANFKVFTVGDGAAALVLVRERAESLRVVITDNHMPNMSGLEFVRVLIKILPNTGIVVASGGLTEDQERQFRSMGVRAIVPKPYSNSSLMSALKKALPVS